MKKILILVAAILMSPGLGLEMAQENPLTLTISTDQKEYILNTDVQVEAKLENTTDKPVQINEFVFDEQSLSFDIGLELKKYTWSILIADPNVRDRAPLTKVTLGPKKSVTGLFKIPTLKPGKMEITGVFNGPEKQKTTSSKLEVNVKSNEAQENKLGAEISITIDDKEKKTMHFELLPDYAPVGVSNFITLAKKGFYNDLKFFRLERSNWFQAGCTYNKGFGGPGFSYKNESGEQTITHDMGTLSLSGYNKFGYCGSQFYVCFAKLSFLDKKYPIIAKATKDTLDFLDKEFSRFEPKTADSWEPLRKVVIDSIKIVTMK